MIDDTIVLLKDWWENYLQVKITPGADALQQTRERVLHYLLLSLTGLSFLVLIPFTADTVTRTQSWELFLAIGIFVIFIWLATFNQQWPYYLRTAVLLSIFYGLTIHDLLTIGLVGANSTFLLVIPLLVFALLNLRAGIFATIGSIGLYALMAWQHGSGNLPLSAANIAQYATGDGWFTIGLFLGLLCLLSTILLGEMSSNVAEALRVEEQLDRTLESEQIYLQTRIDKRTRGLQASTEVSRHISVILDSQQLAETVVQQIQRVFNYYHVQMYEFNADKQYLNLIAATGNAGAELRQRKHRLAAWRGLVGQAGGHGQPQLAIDTEGNSNWLPNPLLPETVAELAVPIFSGDEVIGVLDIQHNDRDSLDEETVYVMQTIASQVAVALQNAALYEQVETEAQQEAMLEQIGQKIRETTSTEEALRVAATELALALNLKRTHIKLGL